MTRTRATKMLRIVLSGIDTILFYFCTLRKKSTYVQRHRWQAGCRKTVAAAILPEQRHRVPLSYIKGQPRCFVVVAES